MSWQFIHRKITDKNFAFVTLSCDNAICQKRKWINYKICFRALDALNDEVGLLFPPPCSSYSGRMVGRESMPIGLCPIAKLCGASGTNGLVHSTKKKIKKKISVERRCGRGQIENGKFLLFLVQLIHSLQWLLGRWYFDLGYCFFYFVYDDDE